MNFKLLFGLLYAFLLIDVTTSQRRVSLLQYLRELLAPLQNRRTIQISRPSQVFSSASSSVGLADIGLGGVIGAGGLMGGTIGLQQPRRISVQQPRTISVQQPRTLSVQRNTRQPTIFTSSADDALQIQRALGMGLPGMQAMDVRSIERHSPSVRHIGPGGSHMMMDQPDPQDPLDIVYAPRSMAGDVARIQRMTDSDAVVLV